MDPSQLCLEITESVLDRGPRGVGVDTLAALKALGVRHRGRRLRHRLLVARATCGASRSTALKIDRSFVAASRTRAEDVAIVDAVIEPRRTRWGCRSTAEGVETAEQLGNLQSTGCDTAQGFLFSRPEHPDVVTRLLR